MGKRFAIAMSFGAILVALSASPASAASSLDSCIQSSTVCFYDGASIGDSDAVEAALQNTGARVAVVPNDGSNSLNPSQAAAQAAQGSGTGELILVVAMDSGKDRFGVYSESGKASKVTAALNGAGKSDGGDAIASAKLGSIYSAPATGAKGSAGSSAESRSIPVLAVGLVLILILFGVLFAMISRNSRRLRDSQSDNQPTAATIANQKSVDLSEDLKKELSIISKTIESYGRSSENRLREAAALLRPIHSHIYELFGRIDRKNSNQNRELARVRYLSILRKLNSTLSKDYFEDIVRNPSLWEDSAAKADSVLAALSSVDRQIIENIRQVNGSKELRFLVEVSSLNGSGTTSVEEAFGDSEGTMDRKTRGTFGS